MSEEMVPGPQPQPPSPLKVYGTIDMNQESQMLARHASKRSYLAIAVLCYINLVNYMDWFVVAGVLLEVQTYFGLEDGTAGLLHTVFILCFLLSAPVFGYLGDRYNRKIILGAGIFFWSSATLGSSFIPPSMAWMFFISRGLVGAGTSSYSTVAPTLIAELFKKGHRTWMLSVFYIFIPVGSGLGYILSSTMAHATGRWSWGFRVTPCMGYLGLILLALLVSEPDHGAAEKHVATCAEENGANSTWCKDVSTLCRNWSFLWSSLGVTAMSFITGALGFWIPLFLYRSQLVHSVASPCQMEPCNISNSCSIALPTGSHVNLEGTQHFSWIFGAITIATGILGVVTGAEASRRYKKTNAEADPIICAIGMLTSAPCLYVAIMLAQESILATYIFIALGEFLLSLNWAIVTDILLCVVKPKRQSTAMSLQIFISHLLGDAGSPYLIGLIASVIQKNRAEMSNNVWCFRSLQYSFVVCTFVGILGGGFFLLTALHLGEDWKKAVPPGQGFENKGYVPHEEPLATFSQSRTACFALEQS